MVAEGLENGFAGLRSHCNRLIRDADYLHRHSSRIIDSLLFPFLSQFLFHLFLLSCVLVFTLAKPSTCCLLQLRLSCLFPSLSIILINCFLSSNSILDLYYIEYAVCSLSLPVSLLFIRGVRCCVRSRSYLLQLVTYGVDTSLWNSQIKPRLLAKHGWKNCLSSAFLHVVLWI